MVTHRLQGPFRAVVVTGGPGTGSFRRGYAHTYAHTSARKSQHRRRARAERGGTVLRLRSATRSGYFRCSLKNDSVRSHSARDASASYTSGRVSLKKAW